MAVILAPYCLFIKGSALLCFEAGVGLVDDVHPAFTANDLAVAVARLQRFEGRTDFHGSGLVRLGIGKAERVMNPDSRVKDEGCSLQRQKGVSAMIIAGLARSKWMATAAICGLLASCASGPPATPSPKPSTEQPPAPETEIGRAHD